MRFDYKDFDSKVGGRSKATYISPWAYVYYTVRDDSAPDDYEKNPNQGIDQKFWISLTRFMKRLITWIKI